MKKEQLKEGVIVEITKDLESTEVIASVKLIEFVEEGLPYYKNPNTSDNSLETWSYQVWTGVVIDSKVLPINHSAKFKIPYLYAEAGKRIQPSNPLKGKHKKLEDMTDKEVDALSEEEYVRILNKPIDSFLEFDGIKAF